MVLITPEKLKQYFERGNFETIILRQKILELFVFLNNTLSKIIIQKYLLITGLCLPLALFVSIDS